jgi:hypothetical protein
VVKRACEKGKSTLFYEGIGLNFRDRKPFRQNMKRSSPIIFVYGIYIR